MLIIIIYKVYFSALLITPLILIVPPCPVPFLFLRMSLYGDFSRIPSPFRRLRIALVRKVDLLYATCII